MICPACGLSNAPGAAACAVCGAPLASGPPIQHLPAGTKLAGGAYTIGKVLGQGGFGITYLGSDVRLRRPVAIKECFPQGCVRLGATVQPSGSITQSDFQATRERFLEEARTLARFEHRGIVRVYTSFEENNTAYMVMEFLRGKSLADIVAERGALPEQEAVGYIEEVGQALEVVHAAGLLHRDIKPENIVVTEDGRVVLVDFGTAREFAAGRTRRMTRMVTPGYAPLEQYGEQAQFGPFTDIYALGATLYHLLTGEVPVQAPDRAHRVELREPAEKRPGIRRAVSGAVMWAMKMRVEERPQSVRAFLNALRGAGGPTAPGAGGGSATQPQPSSPDAANPHEPRIQQILSELARPVSITATRHTARIQQIEQVLERVAQFNRFRAGRPNRCPACQQGDVYPVTGDPTGRCPLCQKGSLEQRPLDPDRCPVCRAGKLTAHSLDGKTIFCPVCRLVPLQAERRKRFGLRIDLWWVCPNCRAELDVSLGSRASLVRIQDDPFGIGFQRAGQTLSIDEWARISQRSANYLVCSQCQAQMDVADAQRLTLAHVAADPHGAGQRHLGKTLLRSAWAKLAAGLPLNAGNTRCPNCRAELEVDAAAQTMALLQAGHTLPDWARPLTGKPMTIRWWYLTAAGKRSGQPGWLCRACSVEFDQEGSLMKLVVAPAGNLSAHVQRSYTLEDWQRLAAGLPTQSGEHQIRGELARLQVEDQKERARLQQAEQERRKQLDAELTGLLKQSFLDGWISQRLETPGVLLRRNEALRWQSPAHRCKQRSTQGCLYWQLDAAGTLLVTTERVLFQAQGGSLWQKPLSKLLKAEVRDTQRIQLAALHFDGLQKPLAFAIGSLTMDVTVLGQKRSITLTPSDLVALLQALAQKAR